MQKISHSWAIYARKFFWEGHLVQRSQYSLNISDEISAQHYLLLNTTLCNVVTTVRISVLRSALNTDCNSVARATPGVPILLTTSRKWSSLGHNMGQSTAQYTYAALAFPKLSLQRSLAHCERGTNLKVWFCKRLCTANSLPPLHA